MTSTLAPVQDCKTAALQYLSDVQANGALVALHCESNLIEYCSANTAEFLGVAPEHLLGKTAAEGLREMWPHLSTLIHGEGKPEWMEWTGGDHPLIVIGHKQGAHRIFEFERATRSPRHWWSHSTRTKFVQELTVAHTLEQCRELLTDWVFTHSGFDRVMLYLFLSHWNGEVVHERCRPGVEGFLGLRFPAADIPPNARRMSTLNLQRAIVDVAAESAPIQHWIDGSDPLDLTYSTLRSAHPVHLQYLQNMGVQASLTLSVVVNAKLRAMVACHHLSARELSIQDRLAFEEIAHLVSLHLTSLLGLIEQRSRSEMRQRLSQLQGALSAAGEGSRFALSHNLGLIREAFAAGGAWLRFEGEDFFVGRVPDKLSLAPMRDLIELFPREQTSHFESLPKSLRSYRALVTNASGVLFIPLGSVDFVALVRPEVIETVNWAGNPNNSEGASINPAQTPGPRNSFAAWSEQVKNTSEPWTDTQIEFSERLRLDVEHFLGTSRLEHIALHDPLTGLANRLLFERRLQEEVRNSMAHNKIFAVHIIDLDRFKQVNDTYGHGAGDQVLTGVAARLRALVAPRDTVARLGGDEFAIIQAGLDDSERAVALAEKIVQSVSQRYPITGDMVEIGVSIGVSSYPSDTVEESELLEYADLALYHVKNSGRNAYSLYTPTMRSVELHDGEGELLSLAIQHDEFRLMYQPIVDARSGDLRGLEAFLRWQRPGAREKVAGEFMPLVEQRRLAPEIGEWVMEEVFRQYRQWLQEGLPMVPITINIADSEFASRDLLGQIVRLGTRYETGWQWLRLDIKEAAVVANTERAIRKLSELREAGVGTNLDNFGNSFIPLGYLTQLPFRGIKLDAILLDEKNSRQRRDALFNVVQSIAQVFGAQLIVTRIETEEMRESLQQEGIDFMQGYAIGRPTHAVEAAAWLLRPESVTTGETETPVESIRRRRNRG